MWLPPPLCAIPTNHHHCVRCPALSAVCVCWWWDWAQRRTVVARTLVWRCAWRLATTPTSHAVHACRLSPLSCPQTHPLTHTQMALLTPHTHGVLCVPRPIHSLTHWLPHCPHTLHTHWWVCVCSSTCSHAPSHTQRRHRRGACLAALVLWSPPPRPLCHTHTHRDWWWAPWWWLVVGVWALCGCHATPPTRLACHHTRHIHHHTHHGVLFVWHALPLPPPPLNPITHTPQQPLCHNGGCHWSPRRPHTPHLPHTRHTHQGQAQAWLWLLVWHHHHAGVGHSLSSLLPFLSTNPFLSLSLACTHTPHPLVNNTTIPSIPCVVCVLWEWTDGWTTLWLSTPHTALLMGVLIGDTIQPFHPPSPLSLCFCPPPTTTPSLFSAHTTQRRKGEWGWTCWCCGCVMDGVGGMCGLWVVLCVGCVLHGLLIPSLCPHQTTTTLPFSSPFTTPLFCLCVEKGVDHKVDGVEWSVVCGMQHISHCAFIKPSPTPVCLSSFTIPFSLSNSFSSSFLVCLVCLDRKSEGQVWDSPCQTHCAPHPIHTTLFPSNHAPPFQ